MTPESAIESTTPDITAATPLTIGTPLRNSRRERFCLALVGGVSQAEAARQAGYSVKVARSHGQRLVTFVDVRIRIAELREILASQRIMTIAARKERLSEIAGARLKDYHNKHGALAPFDDDIPNQGAIAEVQQEYDPDGRQAFPVKVKLHNPIHAIAELNKMEKVYETGTTVNVNQNIVNISVVSPKARKLSDKIVGGERT